MHDLSAHRQLAYTLPTGLLATLGQERENALRSQLAGARPWDLCVARHAGAEGRPCVWRGLGWEAPKAPEASASADAKAESRRHQSP